MSKNEKRIQQLNEAGERWYRERTAGNSASAMAEAAGIIQLAYEMFTESYFNSLCKRRNTVGIKNPDPSIAIHYFYEKAFTSYDPNRGENGSKATLYNYMNYIFNTRFFDIYHEEYGMKKEKRKNPETGEQEDVIITEAALITDFGNGDSTEKDLLEYESFSQLGSVEVNDAETQVLREEKIRKEDRRMITLLSEFCSVILNLPEHLRGKARNPDKLRYYRMFFTDIMSMYMKKQQQDLPLIQRKEADVFQAMLLTFLDFYMSEECRTCLEVSETKLKKYSELVDGRPEEEPKEIYNDIYVSYLDRIEDIQVGVSAVSNQREPFCRLIHEALGIDIVSVHTQLRNKYRTTTFLIGD